MKKKSAKKIPMDKKDMKEMKMPMDMKGKKMKPKSKGMK